MKSYDRNRGLKAGDVIHGLERWYGECICIAWAGRDADRPGYSHWFHLDVQRNQTIKVGIKVGMILHCPHVVFSLFISSHVLNAQLKVRLVCFPPQRAWNIFQLSWF